ncbi:MAG: hypothetical protein WC711_03115 [Candidatus Staskawiczbacteria bacterium]|jgi:hypothetical protein
MQAIYSVFDWLSDHLWWMIFTIFLLWALRIIRVAIIREGTAIAFLSFGSFCYLGMNFRGHGFDENGNVVEGDYPDGYGQGSWFMCRFGGWVIYLWPFVSAVRYAQQNGSADMFGAGIHVRVGNVAPEPMISKAETAAPESVPLDVKFVSVMRIVNLYKWLFVAPRDVSAQVIRRMDSTLRAWVRGGSQERAQAARGNGAQLWQDLVNQGSLPVFTTMENDWGLRILENSVIVEDVGYQPGYQEALEAKSKQQLLAEGEKARVFGPVQLAMQEWITEEARLAGVDSSDSVAMKKLVAKLKRSGEYAQHKQALEQLRSQALAGRGFTKFDVTSGGQPIEANFAAGVTLARELGNALQPLARGDGGNRRGDRRNQPGGGSPPPAIELGPDDLDGL